MYNIFIKIENTDTDKERQYKWFNVESLETLNDNINNFLKDIEESDFDNYECFGKCATCRYVENCNDTAANEYWNSIPDVTEVI